MAYGNYSPFMNGYYPQQYQQVTPQYQPQIPQQADSTMLWVLNKNEADSYPVAPNSSVVLWDKEKPTIYVKSVSANGVPSIRTLDFVERSEMPLERSTINEKDLVDKFATKEDITALRGDYDALKGIVDELLEKKEVKTKATVKKARSGDDE